MSGGIPSVVLAVNPRFADDCRTFWAAVGFTDPAEQDLLTRSLLVPEAVKRIGEQS